MITIFPHGQIISTVKINDQPSNFATKHLQIIQPDFLINIISSFVLINNFTRLHIIHCELHSFLKFSRAITPKDSNRIECVNIEWKSHVHNTIYCFSLHKQYLLYILTLKLLIELQID